MRPFAIAGLQIELAPVGSNLELIKAHVQQVVGLFPWVQMVVLSELATLGPNPANARAFPSPTLKAYQDVAYKHGIWLVTGSLHERVEHEVYNTASVIRPDGAIVLNYRKMFPFRPYAVGISAGTEFGIFDVPGVARFGLSICYDIWFPETTRILAALGAEVLIHPTLTGTIDRDVELAILRATAATNQMYVFDVNGARAGGIGRSCVVGPEGDVIFQAGSGTEHFPIELDFDRVARTRERGILGLGQPLKGFRDAPVRFDVYDPASPLRAGLAALGPLVVPARPVRPGGAG